MGIGKLTRGAGKAAAAIDVALFLWDRGGALVKAIRGKGAAKEAGKVRDDGSDIG
jgi:hypothetical protein